MMRTALISMDVEDWHHLEYFAGSRVPVPGQTMLDGLDRFSAVLDEEGVPGTFFTLGEVAATHGPKLRALADAGHEVASHGPDHTLLKRFSTAEFVERMRGHKDALEQAMGRPVSGYRAPCFSMDEEKLARLPELGFRYDSSWIRFGAHPLYGSMDLTAWEEPVPGAWRDPASGLVEFEVPMAATPLGKKLPAGGGAYFRIFPWTVTRGLVRRFLATAGVYVFYIHPFECSAVPGITYPEGTGMGTKVRFQAGRSKTLPRLRRLFAELRAAGFTFSTYDAAARALAR
ncbi:MAG TPA: polysaccharide deacetylase family protein [Longimicrobium sp.]|nr:polysaccharide deacetylase family protein [Longimicrobium sp.]